MNIESLLSDKVFVTRKELIAATGLSDRKVRKEISRLKCERVVLFNSHRSGYRLARDFSKLTPAEIEEELEAVQQSINELEARKRIFNDQERVYIAYIEAAKKFKNNASKRRVKKRNVEREHRKNGK